MVVLFDIGGTKMRMAVSRDGEQFEKPSIVPTPKRFDEAVRALQRETHRLASGERIEALAGGIRGTLSPDKSRLVYETVLTDWVGKPLRDALQRACGATVYLENDTALAGLGEALRGAGRGSGIVVYVTVSTGVGGARIVDGRIDEHAVGFEPGKMVIDPDNTLCPDCPGNTLEEYVSGMALERRYGVPASAITDPAVWREQARFLAVGLHNMIVHWSPDVVVLGGSMIVGDPGIAVGEVEKHVRETLSAFPALPAIKIAELGDEGGLHGALIYLNQKLQTAAHPL